MLKLRKGDLWKAVLLVILIGGVVAFISRTLRSVSVTPQVPSRASQAKSEVAPAGAATKEMFAARRRAGVLDVAKARATPDPFRPEVAAQAPLLRAPVARPTRGPSLPPPVSLAPALPGFWLTGIIHGGNRPLAVLRSGDERYFVRLGQTLPGGWRVTHIGTQSVALMRGTQRVNLSMGPSLPSPPASPR